MAGGSDIELRCPPCFSTNLRRRSHSWPRARRRSFVSAVTDRRHPACPASPHEIPRLLCPARRRGARPGRLACQAWQWPTAARSVGDGQGAEAAATFDSRCVSLGRQNYPAPLIEIGPSGLPQRVIAAGRQGRADARSCRCEDRLRLSPPSCLRVGRDSFTKRRSTPHRSP